jgi:hypothetical protein
MPWLPPVCWDRFWQVGALLISAATIGAEIMGWSGYVTRRMQE